ncbi:hypothetical protein [Synechococcus sp. PCC 6312]|uniref:hypothetical protein n=1 Tax=Synechococcus sp. (strain ATCC 27167 / PCC 6312) TaxID=195253 RepID=UPI00029EDA2B|nr:hypothetical protein [Synechococcus sp. PCC 6312]AFY59901.1 hypothetical protein Syn6312_0681 [Synechococcus sp. PCC 6312]
MLDPSESSWLDAPLPHPWPAGYVFYSPGGLFRYEVLGACCRLFDREQLPWPCCRLAWRSKEPSWRRVGRRFIGDLAASGHPCYWVKNLDVGAVGVMTLYTVKLSRDERLWWSGKR